MSWMIIAEHERLTAAAYTTESPEEMEHEDHFTQIHTRHGGTPALIAKVQSQLKHAETEIEVKHADTVETVP